MGPDASEPTESIEIHPDRMFVNVAFVKFASDQFTELADVLKSSAVNTAPLKSTRGPCKYPPITLYFAGSSGALVLRNVMPPDRVFVNVALDRFALVSTVLLRSRPVKFTPDRSTFAPTRYPLRTTYPADVPAVNTGAFAGSVGCGIFLDRVRMNVAPVKLDPSIIVPEISAYEKFVPVKMDPLSERPYSCMPDKSFPERLIFGPSKYLFKNTWLASGRMVVVADEVVFPDFTYVIFAPVKFTPVKSMFVKSNPDRSAPTKLILGPIM